MGVLTFSALDAKRYRWRSVSRPRGHFSSAGGFLRRRGVLSAKQIAICMIRWRLGLGFKTIMALLGGVLDQYTIGVVLDGQVSVVRRLAARRLGNGFSADARRATV